MNKTAAKIVMPMIGVESVDAAREFYVETLGFDHKMGVVGKDGQLDFCSVMLGGAQMIFHRAQAPARGASPNGKQPVEIYFEVADVQAYHDQLRKKQVKITDGLTTQWWGDRTFKVRDPNGYEIWFYQTIGEVKPPAGVKIV